jgi:hypothetical protein
MLNQLYFNSYHIKLIFLIDLIFAHSRFILKFLKLKKNKS